MNDILCPDGFLVLWGECDIFSTNNTESGTLSDKIDSDGK